MEEIRIRFLILCFEIFIEKSAIDRANQDRIKINYLRQKLLDGDDKMEKMKKTIDALSKECARRDSEAFTRRERSASPQVYDLESGDSDSIWGDSAPARPPPRNAGGPPSQPRNRDASSQGGIAPNRSSVLENTTSTVDKKRPTAGPSGTKPTATATKSTASRAPTNVGPQRGSSTLERQKNVPDRSKAPNGHARATALARAGIMKEISDQRSSDQGGSSDTTLVDEQSSWADDYVSDSEVIASVSATLTQNKGPSDTGVTVTASSNVQNPVQRRVTPETTNSLPASNPTNGTTNPETDSTRGVKRTSDTIPVVKDTQQDSYAGAASKYRWQEPTRKKKRKASRSGSENELPDLSGFEDAPNREIFVRELAYGKCRKPSDLERMVKRYCNDRGVDILFAKTYLLRFSHDKANCRVKVKESDVDAVLKEGFWQRCVTARLWLSNAEFNANKEERNSDGELFSD